MLALLAALAVVAVGLLSVSPSTAGTSSSASTAAGSAPATARHPHGPKPTVVLVHGAFADSSGWREVSEQLMDEGYPVLAFSNPLRGPTYDGEYLRQFLTTIDGPIVLVGHSYGGVVITNAATGNPDVEALVYVAAYAPAEGESVQDANKLGGGHTDVVDHLVVRPFPDAGPQNGDAYIDPAWFRRLFAQDLPRDEAAFLAASQRPGALAALGLASGPPAWKEIPSYYLVASGDRIIPPEAERAMARRARAHTVEVNASHSVMMSRPHQVTKLILRAAR